MSARRGLVGKKFGWFSIIADLPDEFRRQSGKKKAFRMVLARCRCGVKKGIRFAHLLSGTKSCGCAIRSTERKAKIASVISTHGDARLSQRAPEYRAWCDMKTRCYNQKSKSFADYGARGIRVCDRWLNSYDAFLRDMGRKPSADHSLDRIDNNSNYGPKNCRWATRSMQMKNRRPRSEWRNSKQKQSVGGRP